MKALKPFEAKFGWKPDLPDIRDFRFAKVMPKVTLPSKIDLRKVFPVVFDQGQLGSCTANAIAGHLQFNQKVLNLEIFTPSRLFIYYNERVMEHTVNEDSGAMLRDGIKTVAKKGACSETMWEYNISKFTQKPPVPCYNEAQKHKALAYHRLGVDLIEMKTCLANGRPFVFGFSVYDSFMSNKVATYGVVPMPKTSESLLGGHAVLAVGYNDRTKQVIVRNSWGKEWGKNGYFYMPYDYISDDNLCDDFWTITTQK